MSFSEYGRFFGEVIIFAKDENIVCQHKRKEDFFKKF
jgi:hypothetical protein